MMLDESCEGMVHMYSGEQTSVHKAPTSLPVWLYMRQADQRVPDFKKHSSACQSLSRTEECEGGGEGSDNKYCNQQHSTLQWQSSRSWIG